MTIYARNEYAVHINNQLSQNVEGIFESLFLQLYGPSKIKILTGELYRSPSGSVSDFIADKKPEPRCEISWVILTLIL